MWPGALEPNCLDLYPSSTSHGLYCPGQVALFLHVSLKLLVNVKYSSACFTSLMQGLNGLMHINYFRTCLVMGKHLINIIWSYSYCSY